MVSERRDEHNAFVPKINAPTVVEHRAAQRSAILRAAAKIAATEGLSAINPKSVGEQIGIARSSVYEYFRSRDDLLVAVAIGAFEEWAREISAELAGVEAGRPRLRRYIEATMEIAADGHHVLADALRSTDIAPSRVAEIAALHKALVGPLEVILSEVGVPDAREVTPFVQALIGVGLKQVAQGREPGAVAERTFAVVVGGVCGG